MAYPTNDELLIIRRNDFLAQLQPEDYEALNVVHNFIMAEKNAYLYFDAQYHNKLYFVKQGHVRIGYVDDEGNEFIKDILQPGDVFGQLTLERTHLNGEFAQAHKDETILCAFNIEDFQRLLLHKPTLAVVFAKKVGSRLQRVESRLLNLLQRDVRTRLLYFLWTILPPSETASGAVTMPNYLTHEDIARLTGTSRQTVTTLLNQLDAEGFLHVDRKQIVVRDIKWLQKEAKVS